MILLVLACGSPVPPATPIPAPPVLPAPPAALPPPDPPAPAPAAIEELPRIPPGGVDPTLVVTAAPIATDEGAFVAREVGATGPRYVRYNELSGMAVGHGYPLSKDRVIRGVPCAASSDVFIGDDTWACRLASPWQSGGLTVAADQYMTLRLDSVHPLMVPLDNEVTVSGIPAVVFMKLDDNGGLYETILGKAFRFPGDVDLPADTRVTLAGGRVVEAQLMSPAIIHGKSYPGMWDVHFDARGVVIRDEYLAQE